jgi:hypothetical protein
MGNKLFEIHKILENWEIIEAYQKLCVRTLGDEFLLMRKFNQHFN